MHYSCLVITRDFPTVEDLGEILRPFSEDEIYAAPEGTRAYPVFSWDYYVIGGRYAGNMKLRADVSDEKYKWLYFLDKPRNNRLFHSFLLYKMVSYATKAKMPFSCCEEDYFTSLGLNDGYIRVDGCKISDMLNFDEISCYYCLDADGNAIGRSSWDGDQWNDDPDFEAKLSAIKQASKDYYACIVDLHS